MFITLAPAEQEVLAFIAPLGKLGWFLSNS